MTNHEKYKKLWNLKTRVFNLESTLEKEHKWLLQPERDIIAFIGCYPGTTIMEIVNHPFFKGISLSTIKRSVKALKTYNLVYQGPNSQDKRERPLYATEEWKL